MTKKMTKVMKKRLLSRARRFVAKHGGYTEVSRRLTVAALANGERPISPQAVYNWTIEGEGKGKIPHKRLALIEQAYGVPPLVLRPDRDW